MLTTKPEKRAVFSLFGKVSHSWLFTLQRRWDLLWTSSIDTIDYVTNSLYPDRTGWCWLKDLYQGVKKKKSICQAANGHHGDLLFLHLTYTHAHTHMRTHTVQDLIYIQQGLSNSQTVGFKWCKQPCAQMNMHIFFLMRRASEYGKALNSPC